MKKKNALIAFRVTAEERKQVEKNAHFLNMEVSDYCRKAVLSPGSIDLDWEKFKRWMTSE